MNELRAALDLRPRRTWRATKNTLMSCVLGLALVIVALPLAHIIYSVTARGAGVAFQAFPTFFTSEIPIVSRRAGPGMGPAILGTLMVTGGAMLISVPLGILGA